MGRRKLKLALNGAIFLGQPLLLSGHELTATDSDRLSQNRNAGTAHQSLSRKLTCSAQSVAVGNELISLSKRMRLWKMPLSIAWL